MADRPEEEPGETSSPPRPHNEQVRILRPGHQLLCRAAFEHRYVHVVGREPAASLLGRKLGHLASALVGEDLCRRLDWDVLVRFQPDVGRLPCNADLEVC